MTMSLMTVIVSGIPEFISINKIAKGFEFLLDKYDIGRFRLWEIGRNASHKKLVALDFDFGFVAFSVQNLLDNYKFECKGKSYVVNTRISMDPTHKPRMYDPDVEIITAVRESHQFRNPYALVPYVSSKEAKAQKLQVKFQTKMLKKHAKLLAAERKFAREQRKLHREYLRKIDSVSDDSESPPRKKRSHSSRTKRSHSPRTRRSHSPRTRRSNRNSRKRTRSSSRNRSLESSTESPTSLKSSSSRSRSPRLRYPRPKSQRPRPTTPSSPRPTTPSSPRPRATRSGSPRPRATTPRSERPRATTPSSQRPRATTPRSQRPRAATPRSPRPKATTPRSQRPRATRSMTPRTPSGSPCSSPTLKPKTPTCSIKSRTESPTSSSDSLEHRSPRRKSRSRFARRKSRPRYARRISRPRYARRISRPRYARRISRQRSFRRTPRPTSPRRTVRNVLTSISRDAQSRSHDHWSLRQIRSTIALRSRSKEPTTTDVLTSSTKKQYNEKQSETDKLERPIDSVLNTRMKTMFDKAAQRITADVAFTVQNETESDISHVIKTMLDIVKCRLRTLRSVGNTDIKLMLKYRTRHSKREDVDLFKKLVQDRKSSKIVEIEDDETSQEGLSPKSTSFTAPGTADSRIWDVVFDDGQIETLQEKNVVCETGTNINNNIYNLKGILNNKVHENSTLKTPRFVLLRQMKPLLNVMGAECKYLYKITSLVLKDVLIKMMKNKGYCNTSNIVGLFRKEHPKDQDEMFLKEIVEAINNGKYDDECKEFEDAEISALREESKDGANVTGCEDVAESPNKAPNENNEDIPKDTTEKNKLNEHEEEAQEKIQILPEQVIEIKSAEAEQNNDDTSVSGIAEEGVNEHEEEAQAKSQILPEQVIEIKSAEAEQINDDTSVSAIAEEGVNEHEEEAQAKSQILPEQVIEIKSAEAEQNNDDTSVSVITEEGVNEHEEEAQAKSQILPEQVIEIKSAEAEQINDDTSVSAIAEEGVNEHEEEAQAKSQILPEQVIEIKSAEDEQNNDDTSVSAIAKEGVNEHEEEAQAKSQILPEQVIEIKSAGAEQNNDDTSVSAITEEGEKETEDADYDTRYENWLDFELIKFQENE